MSKGAKSGKGEPSRLVLKGSAPALDPICFEEQKLGPRKRPLLLLLPLGGARRLGREVKCDARDPGHLTRLQPADHVVHRLEGHLLAGDGGGACHEVVCDEGANADRVRAGDAEGAGKEHHGHLRQLAHQLMLLHSLCDDIVGVLQLLAHGLCECGRRHVAYNPFNRLSEDEAHAVHRVCAAGDALGELSQFCPLLGCECHSAVCCLLPSGDPHEVRVRAPVSLHAHCADG
mmetsp:Transcript_4484/g.11499  ORF Transcript_4484/g.11499 Transcript_4484/m.11499 type:complete len:231 (+) Transcript_4484:236-928(+)